MSPPSAHTGAVSSVPFLLCSSYRPLSFLKEAKVCFGRYHGSLLLAIWPAYTPSDTQWVSESLCGQGNAPASSLKPPCIISDTSSPYARSVWASQAIKIFQDSHASVSLSPLCTWKTSELSFHQILGEDNAGKYAAKITLTHSVREAIKRIDLHTQIWSFFT